MTKFGPPDTPEHTTAPHVQALPDTPHVLCPMMHTPLAVNPPMTTTVANLARMPNFRYAIFFYRIGFKDASVYSKIIRVHRIICSSWHNLHYNSYGPQPETILISNAFSTRLLLEKFDAPLVVAWYERLTSTCEGFRIALVTFNAIQFC
jgi:hypothetical protein